MGLRSVIEHSDPELARRSEVYELSSVLHVQLRTLSRLPDYLSQETVDGAATALLGARRIYVYGHDFARAAVEFMQRKLRMMGFDVVAIQHGVDEAAELLVSAQGDDILLAYVFESQRREAARLLRQVSAGGMTTILITDHTSLTLRPAPTYLLAAPRTLGHRRTMVVPLVISYSLEYSLIHLAPERVSVALARAV
jgi:DNA-binding MurR/RpiR family transcriptional regulator